MSKIQHGLIAAQDIGDDKLVTVQAMSDLIENKARQLEHDSKILDFGKDDDEETYTAPVRGQAANAGVTNAPTATNPSTKTTTSSGTAKATKEKEPKEKEAGSGKGQVKRRSKKVHAEPRSQKNNDRDDDEMSTISNRSSGSRQRNSTGTAGNKRAGVKRKATGKRSSAQITDKGDDSDREVDLSNLDIDPDEPRYCTCDQVISPNFYLLRIALIPYFATFRCRTEK